MPQVIRPLSIYVHWPFCLSKCPYCDFNSHVESAVDHSQWLKAYEAELDYFAESDYFKDDEVKIKTIFFGGGTPSLMSPKTVEGIINKISKLWHLDEKIEITLEANPTSFEAAKFRDFKSAGIERVSIGVQSLIDEDLKKLGRGHNSSTAKEAIKQASKIFKHLSFDLIYARSGQTLEAWQEELNEAMSLARGHISLYQLTIEKGTPFYKAYREGQLILPDSESAADMYDWTNDYLHKNGYERYEISNYAIPGQECRHNLAYWHYDEYLGIGPGAHSRLRNPSATDALMMWHKPSKWLQSVSTHDHGIQTYAPLSQQELVEEVLMMGLRLKEGLNLERFKKITDLNLLDVINQKKLNQYMDLGLIEPIDDYLRLTDKGLMMHNYLVARLV